MYISIRLVILVAYISQAYSDTFRVSQSSESFDSVIPSCNKETEVDDTTIHQAITQVLKTKNIDSVWLPIKKNMLESWQWIDGTTYDGSYGSDHDLDPKVGCAVLDTATSLFQEEKCPSLQEQYLCQDNYRNCTSLPSSLKCVHHKSTSYIVSSGKKSWFEAKGSCDERQSLATVSKSDAKELLLMISAVNQNKGKVWIGLQHDNYVIVKNSKTVRRVQSYFWAPGSPESCSDDCCVILSKSEDGNYYWKTESCQASHPHICVTETQPGGNNGDATVSGSSHGKDSMTPGALEIGLLVGFGLFVLVIIIVASTFCILKRKQLQLGTKKATPDEEQPFQPNT